MYIDLYILRRELQAKYQKLNARARFLSLCVYKAVCDYNIFRIPSAFDWKRLSSGSLCVCVCVNVNCGQSSECGLRAIFNIYTLRLLPVYDQTKNIPAIHAATAGGTISVVIVAKPTCLNWFVQECGNVFFSIPMRCAEHHHTVLD